MPNIILKEAAVLSPSMTSRKELKFTLKIKPEDYGHEEMEAIFDAFENGDSLAVVMTPFQREFDPMPKLRQTLALKMKEYCEREGYVEKEEVKKLYVRNNVSSREHLTEDQLRREIDKYEAGLLSY